MHVFIPGLRDKGQRLPRFTPMGREVLPFHIEERDLYAWRWVYDCRFLPMAYLHLLLPGSAQQLTRRASSVANFHLQAIWGMISLCDPA
jgi:hypothetical protein